MDKLERMLNLTAVLIETITPLETSQIKDKIEGYPQDQDSFLRAFARDKAELRALGIPIEVYDIPYSKTPGYRIDRDDYYLSDFNLSNQELQAINLASLQVRHEGNSSSVAIWKLGGSNLAEANLLESDELEGIDLDDQNVDAKRGDINTDSTILKSLSYSKDAIASLPTDPNLEPIYSAICAEKSLKFKYKDELRSVDPWRLDFHRGRWYLLAYDSDKSSIRNFRVDRITSVPETYLNLDRQSPETDLARNRVAWQYGENPIPITVRVDSGRAEMFLREISEYELLSVDENKSQLIKVEVSNFVAFRDLLLDYLQHVELIEPAKYRQEFVEHLDRVKVHHG